MMDRADWYQGCGRELDIPLVDGAGPGALVHPAFDVSALDALEAGGEYVAEPKYDGIWGIVWGARSGNRIFSRTGRQKTFDLPPLGPGNALIGELGCGSQRSRKTAAQLGHPFMDVFDAAYLAGKAVWQLDGAARRSRLLAWFGREGRRLPTGSGALVHPSYRLAPRFESGFADLFLREEEGIVLKRRDDGPIAGGKSAAWIKAKKQATADMVIMDWERSDAERFATGPGALAHPGLCKSITCGQYVGDQLHSMVRVGGMPTEWRERFARQFPRWRGRVVEIAHFGQFESGALRHPSFVRIRDDKPPAECVFAGTGRDER